MADAKRYVKQQPNGVYHYQRKITKRVAAVYGESSINRSLRTKDLAIAHKRAIEVHGFMEIYCNDKEFIDKRLKEQSHPLANLVKPSHVSWAKVFANSSPDDLANAPLRELVGRLTSVCQPGAPESVELGVSIRQGRKPFDIDDLNVALVGAARLVVELGYDCVVVFERMEREVEAAKMRTVTMGRARQIYERFFPQN